LIPCYSSYREPFFFLPPLTGTVPVPVFVISRSIIVFKSSTDTDSDV
jgi:hypothetical protein